jgi:hypothetical protein
MLQWLEVMQTWECIKRQDKVVCNKHIAPAELHRAPQPMLSMTHAFLESAQHPKQKL